MWSYCGQATEMGLIPGSQVICDRRYQFGAARLRFDMIAVADRLPCGINRGIRQLAS